MNEATTNGPDHGSGSQKSAQCRMNSDSPSDDRSSRKLRILHLEDSVVDAELVQCVLQAGHIDCEILRVQSRPDFIAEMERGEVDLVIADLALPGLSGMTALAILREKWPEIPCILVSGSVGEEVAVESLKGGAVDYVLKDRLARLAPAVQRAMKELEDRARRRRLEEQIVRTQKMEILGQLAAGVAHDFNNVLSIILGCSEMILIDECSPDQRNYAEMIRHAADRASNLTRQLLIFTRKQKPLSVVLDPSKAVEDLEKMIRRLVDETIDLSVITARDVGRIEADASYVWQILMNLVVNARDAMPHGGKLTIETKNAVVKEDSAQRHPGIAPGEYVVLSVSDTGSGMTEAVKARLFDPFFSTKPAGKGTGLGLATCQTIAKQFGAHIEFDSEIGNGTNFRVYFPRVDLPAERTHEVRGQKTLPGGTETLLVVEDEPEIRELARTMLQARGYNVICASHGKEGLAVARSHAGPPIQLVVTDVVMPHMDGRTMSDAIREMWPDMKILFTSGYTDQSIMQLDGFQPGVAFLPKPYSVAALCNTVRGMLDKK